MDPETLRTRNEKPRLQSKGWPSTRRKILQQYVASPLRNSFVPEPGSPGDTLVYHFPRSTSSETESGVKARVITCIAAKIRTTPTLRSRKRSIEPPSRVRTRATSNASVKSKASKIGTFQQSDVMGETSSSQEFMRRKTLAEAVTAFNNAAACLYNFSDQGGSRKLLSARERGEYMSRMLRSLTTVRKRICLLDWAIGRARVRSDERLTEYRAERDHLREGVDAMQDLYGFIRRAE